MAELIYNVRKVFCYYLKSQKCKYYNIPEYQRGYKWTPDNVRALLNDVWNFNGKGEQFYCLQSGSQTD